MKPFCPIIALIALFIAPMQAKADWSKLAGGLHYQALEIRAPVNPATGQAPKPQVIHAFKVDPSKYAFKPIIANPITDAAGMARSTGALVAINANFFDEQNKPLGLIVRDHKTLNAFKNISWWGVFAQEGSKASIVHSTEYKPRPSISQAVQAGPRLLVNGAIPPKLKVQLSRKTALGIDRNGMVLLIATAGYMNTLEFAQILAKSEKHGGLGCVQALNLDGGSSTQAYARVGNFELTLPSFARVPVGLGVFRK